MASNHRCPSTHQLLSRPLSLSRGNGWRSPPRWRSSSTQAFVASPKAAYSPLHPANGETVISGAQLDAAMLGGVLRMTERFGLELVEISSHVNSDR
jgi:hypothetical protein